MHNAQVFCVEDATQDERFRDNPLVVREPHIRYYAGAPIPTPEGFMLGTVCVLDHEPRPLQAEHLSTLEACAQEVSAVLMRRAGGPAPDIVA